MTESQQTADEIIDLLLENDFPIDVSFEIRLSIMIESLNELIDILLQGEEYERCAMYRDTIIELKRYGKDGDKASTITERMQA